jgi:hypothetical protein
MEVGSDGYLEHAVVKSVWSWFSNELCGSPELLEGPVVLLL